MNLSEISRLIDTSNADLRNLPAFNEMISSMIDNDVNRQRQSNNEQT